MAQIVKNKKNFRVVKFSQDETYKLGWGIPDKIESTDMNDYTIISHVGNSINKGACLCTHCNEIIKGSIFYLPILHDTFCKDCYETWINNPNTINYAEDREYEEGSYNNLKEELKAFNIPLEEEEKKK